MFEYITVHYSDPLTSIVKKTNSVNIYDFNSDLIKL